MNISKVFLMRETLHNTISNTKNCFRKKSFFPLCSKWYEWRYPNELSSSIPLGGKIWVEFLPQSELELQTTIQWGVGRQGFLPNLVKICINGELIYRPSTIKEVRGSTKWRFTSSPESNSDLKQNVAPIWLLFEGFKSDSFLHTEYIKGNIENQVQ